jgi:hypothetical protein
MRGTPLFPNMHKNPANTAIFMRPPAIANLRHWDGDNQTGEDARAALMYLLRFTAKFPDRSVELANFD